MRYKRKTIMYLGLSIATLILIFQSIHTVNVKNHHTDIVLVGANGDLSKKYLWSSFFKLFMKYHSSNSTFRFIACGRTLSKEGTKLTNEILQDKIKCDKDDTKCVAKRQSFIESLQYIRTKTEDDFEDLKQFLDSLKKTDVSVGRIFYLAIAPSAYVDTSYKLYNCCYHANQNSWTRLVLEKPFGRDQSSAEKMAADIYKYYVEEDIYRVDHYLGKSVVKNILPFRMVNREKMEHLLNNRNVERIEIVMKESIGVKGRIEFYDQYGVVRDVMQNHLTELLALVTMDLPFDINDQKSVDQKRLDLLDKVEVKSLLLGQYQSYLQQAADEKDNTSQSMKTPTFASALLKIQNSRWYGVPIVMMSGKELGERSSFIRIMFKNDIFCVSGCNRLNGSNYDTLRQIIFQINPNQLPSPGILVSKSLFKPYLPDTLKELVISTKHNDLYGQSINDFHFYVPIEDHNAYAAVVEDLYLGKKTAFVSTERLTKLWKIWSKPIENSASVLPRRYIENGDPSLNFVIKQDELHFIRPSLIRTDNEKLSTDSSIFSGLPSSYLGFPLVVKPESDLLKSLVNHIQEFIWQTLQTKQEFHLAVSGGKTSKKLFEALRQLMLPWQQIHIWLVDERCVTFNDRNSNFNLLQKELLRHADIPYQNIHPMPVQNLGHLCKEDHHGDKIYEDELKHFTNLKINYIVLGLGSDGHTASLMPNSKNIKENDKFVTYTQDSKLDFKRMTFTYSLINQAQHISVLATGSHKRQIISDLLVDRNPSRYPIQGVKPANGNMTFYFDNEAWFPNIENVLV